MITIKELKPVSIKGVKIIRVIQDEKTSTVFLKCKQKGALFYLKVIIEFYDDYAYIIPYATLLSDRNIPFINQITYYVRMKIEELNRYRLRVLTGDFEIRTGVPVIYQHDKNQFRSVASDIFFVSLSILGFLFTTVPLFILLSVLLGIHQTKRWFRKHKMKKRLSE